MTRTVSSSFYKFLWILAHNLAALSLTLFYIGSEFREKIINFLKIITKDRRKSTDESDRHQIECHTSYVKKLPKHLAVILTLEHDKDVDLGRLCKIVEWSLVAGVNFLTFYDYRGVLKNSLNQQFEQLIQQIELASEHEKIVWGQHYEHKQFPHRNGYRRHLVVNLLAAEDGRRKFTKLLQEQLVTVKSDDITCNLIDEKMSAMYGAMPDPDCAVYFGSFQCTQGLLPWQIRLTEFYQLSYELSTISPQKYLNVIYKYGKCEQRFGK